MSRLRRVMLGLSRFVPESIVRAAGRRQTGIFRLAHVAAHAASSGPVRIQRGFGMGLTFDAGPGGPAGYALGTWEPEVQNVLQDELHPGGVLWDLGAAHGFHAVAAARAVGQSGAVVAIEPYGPNAELLRRNVRRNGLSNVDVREVGVSARPERAVFVDETGDTVSVELRHDEGDANDGVQVTTLDELAQLGIPEPTLVMMDVEGAEADVLRGGREVLRRTRPTLLIEVHDTWDEVRAVLTQLGYDPIGVELEDRSTATSVHVLTRPISS